MKTTKCYFSIVIKTCVKNINYSFMNIRNEWKTKLMRNQMKKQWASRSNRVTNEYNGRKCSKSLLKV